MTARPQDPHAGALCTSCNAKKPGMNETRRHCPSPTCPWWRCVRCGAMNDSTGANNVTLRDGTTRPKTMPAGPETREAA